MADANGPDAGKKVLGDREPLGFRPQEIPNFTILAANPCARYFSTLFGITMRTGHSDEGRYGFFLCLEERARGSPIESYFCDCVSQKLLNRGNFFGLSHRQPRGKPFSLKLDAAWQCVVYDVGQACSDFWVCRCSAAAPRSLRSPRQGRGLLQFQGKTGPFRLSSSLRTHRSGSTNRSCLWLRRCDTASRIRHRNTRKRSWGNTSRSLRSSGYDDSG